MQSKATTVDAYLASLPDDRRAALAAVRAVIAAALPAGYEEGMQYGMIGYYVPHTLHPAGYHVNPSEPLPFVSLGSQKNHMAVYLMCVYGDPALKAWFVDEYRKSGKKLDMGKSCVRFKRLDDLPLELIGRAVARVPVAELVARHERLIPASGRKAGAAPTAKAASAPTAKPEAQASPRLKKPKRA